MGKEAQTKLVAAHCPTDLATAFARLAKRRERSLSAELRLAMRAAVAANGLENDESPGWTQPGPRHDSHGDDRGHDEEYPER